MSLIINSLVPVFLIIFLGWYASKSGIINSSATRIFSSYILYFSFPALLFVSTLSLKAKDFNFAYIIGFFICLTFVYLLSFLTSRFIFKLPIKDNAINALCCAFPNTSFLGIPILAIVFGSSSIVPIIIANLIISFSIIPFTIVMCELNKRNKQSVFFIITNSLITTFKSPMVFSPLIGCFFAITNLNLPVSILKAVTSLGDSTYACALFTIGLTLAALEYKINKNVLVNVVTKLILHPLIAIVFFYLLNIHGFFLKVGVLLLAMPTAITPIIYSHYYQAYEENAAYSVFWSTILSVISISVILLVVNYLG